VSISVDGEGLEDVARRDSIAVENCTTTVVISAFSLLISCLINMSSLAYSLVVVIAAEAVDWRLLGLVDFFTAGVGGLAADDN